MTISETKSICIHVRYFASLRETIGKSEESLTIENGTNVAGVRTLLLTLYPEVEKPLARAVCAVNHQYRQQETILHEGDEIVFIPPVGGGSDKREE